MLKMHELRRYTVNDRKMRVFIMDANINSANVDFYDQLFLDQAFPQEERIIYDNVYVKPEVQHVFVSRECDDDGGDDTSETSSTTTSSDSKKKK